MHLNVRNKQRGIGRSITPHVSAVSLAYLLCTYHGYIHASWLPILCRTSSAIDDIWLSLEAFASGMSQQCKSPTKSNL